MLRDLFEYLWKNKMWWLAPAVVVTIAMGALILFAGGGQISPFIYVFF